MVRWWVGDKQCGLTLTEVMVTLAIIGLLASVGLPTYAAHLPRYRLHAAARQVLSDLLLARKSAMSELHVVRLQFREPQHYQLWQDRNHNRRLDTGEVTLKSLSKHGVTLQSTNDPRFHPTGTVTDLPTIILTHTSAPTRLRRCLSISIAGRIKLSSCNNSRS